MELGKAFALGKKPKAEITGDDVRNGLVSVVEALEVLDDMLTELTTSLEEITESEPKDGRSTLDRLKALIAKKDARIAELEAHRCPRGNDPPITRREDGSYIVHDMGQ